MHRNDDDDEPALLARISRVRRQVFLSDKERSEALHLARCAVELLLSRNSAWLRRLCAFELKRDDAAKDCLQEVLIEIAQALPTFAGRSELRTWMFAIARRVIRRRRYRERRYAERFPSSGDPLDGCPSNECAPEGANRMEKAEDQRVLMECVEQLPERQRHSVLLHYLEDLSIEEVAVRLGCSEGSVKTHLFRARARLRELMKGAGPTGALRARKAGTDESRVLRRR